MSEPMFHVRVVLSETDLRFLEARKVSTTTKYCPQLFEIGDHTTYGGVCVPEGSKLMSFAVNLKGLEALYDCGKILRSEMLRTVYDAIIRRYIAYGKLEYDPANRKIWFEQIQTLESFLLVRM